MTFRTPLAALLGRRRAPTQPTVRHVAHYERVLGTSLELQVGADNLETAREAGAALLAEIDRLERVFSRFDQGSELNRWQATQGEDVPVSPELGELLRDALTWWARTGGAFHPGADALGELWKRAAAEGTLPTDAELGAVVAVLGAAPYQVSGNTARKLTALPLNFNAIAKGRIADRACEAAARVEGVTSVLVNLGGDLRAIGTAPIEVAVADPFTRADNAPPVARVRVCGGAVASSGASRRGFQIGGRSFSHVLDPRSGRPASGVAGASVLAPDCATADALATAFGVLAPRESLALADSIPDVGCLIFSHTGEVFSNARWRRAASSKTPTFITPREVLP